MLTLMFIIGLISGIVTGLLSVGGGIILISFLMFLPPIITDVHFTMQTIAGFSIMQAFFSTLSGAFYYIRAKLIDTKVVLYLGIPAMFGGILGAYTANFTSEIILKTIFAVLSIIAAVIMQFSYKTGNQSESYSFTLIKALLNISGGILIGLLGGLTGLAAGFIFVPAMMYIFHLPIKKAIGSSLITCFLLSLGSLITKLGLGNLSIELGSLLILGGIIGAQIGGRIGTILSSLTLKRMAGISILLISIKLFYDLF